jgi:hypothetical protein
VIVAETSARMQDGWPTARHAYHHRSPQAFLRSLHDGDEFAVWQLAYGRALLLDPPFAAELQRAEIASCKTVAVCKRRLIARREELVAVFTRCEDWEAVCTESLLIGHQRARLLLLEHCVVPGCRDEGEAQLNAVAPLEAQKWRTEINTQLKRLFLDYTKALVTKAASVARVQLPSSLAKPKA